MHALLPFAGDVRGVHGKCPCPVAAAHHVRDRGHPGTRRRKRRRHALAVAHGLASHRALTLPHALIRLAILVVCPVPVVPHVVPRRGHVCGVAPRPRLTPPCLCSPLG